MKPYYYVYRYGHHGPQARHGTIESAQKEAEAVPNNQDYKIKYILGILNSKLLAWFFRNKHNEFDTLFPQIKVTEFKKLPIAKTSKQTPLIEIVDRIIAVKHLNKAAGTTTLELELDQQVYALYGLTPEEIAIVEGAAK